jgi:transcription factor SPN1
VPAPSTRDYVNRPKSSAEIEISRGSGKKAVSRFEQMKRSFTEKTKQSKVERAVKMSIEGRKM